MRLTCRMHFGASAKAKAAASREVVPRVPFRNRVTYHKVYYFMKINGSPD